MKNLCSSIKWWLKTIKLIRNLRKYQHIFKHDHFLKDTTWWQIQEHINPKNIKPNVMLMHPDEWEALKKFK